VIVNGITDHGSRATILPLSQFPLYLLLRNKKIKNVCKEEISGKLGKMA